MVINAVSAMPHPGPDARPHRRVPGPPGMENPRDPHGDEIVLYLGHPTELIGRDSFGRLLSPSGARLIRDIAADVPCRPVAESDLGVEPDTDAATAFCHPVRHPDGRSQCDGCRRWYSVSHTTTESNITTAVVIAARPVGVDVQYERRRAGALRGLARMTGREIGTVGWPDWVATEALIKAQGRAGVRPAHGTVGIPELPTDSSWTRVEDSWQVLVEPLEPELWLSIAVEAPRS